MGSCFSRFQRRRNARSIGISRAPAIKQTFSLPDSIIYYITKNPSSPKAYLKMAMSCKYFFEKQPIIVVERLYNDEDDDDNGINICSSSSAKACRKKERKCCINVDISKLNSKIWITNELHFCDLDTKDIADLLIPKIYKCQSSSEFKFWSGTINLEELKLWSTKIQKFSLLDVQFTQSDKSTVMLDEVLKAVPNAKEIFYGFPDDFDATQISATLQNISKLKDLRNLRSLLLMFNDDNVLIEDLLMLLKSPQNMGIMLAFDGHISGEYKTQLNGLIDIIIQSKLKHRCVWYRGQNNEKLKIMNHCLF